MKRLYSKSFGCTYLPSIHSEIPDDAIEISDELYESVIGNPPAGKVRAHDVNGLPYLVDAPKIVPDLAALERKLRNDLLSSVIWIRDRHRDQMELDGATTLEDRQFRELLAYIQMLRDWPQTPEFPDSLHRPVAPIWIADQIK